MLKRRDMEQEKDIIQSQESESVKPQNIADQAKSKFPTPLDLIVLLLILVFSQAVVNSVLASSSVSEEYNSVDVEQFVDFQTFKGKMYALAYPIGSFITFVCALLYIRFRGCEGRLVRVSARGFNPNIILIGFTWLIAMQVVVEPVTLLFPTAEQQVNRGLWAIITSVLFVPIFEELFFRGLILESLLKRHRRLFSVIVSSVIFAVVHVNPAVMITAFVSGLVLGTIYLHTNSVFSTIILHSINNAIAYALITLDLDGFSYHAILGGGTLYYSIYGVCLILAGLFTYETWRRRS